MMDSKVPAMVEYSMPDGKRYQAFNWAQIARFIDLVKKKNEVRA